MITTTTGKGSLIFWDSANVDKKVLTDLLIECGLKEFTPKGRTNLTVLYDSLKTVYSEKDGYLIRQLNAQGYEILREQKGLEKNERQYICSYFISASLDKVIMTNVNEKELSFVNNMYEGLNKYFTPNDVSRTLKNIIMSVPNGLYGTSLRSCGGIYWLAESSMTIFRILSEKLEKQSPVRIYHVNHELGEKEKQVVLEGILDELAQKINTISTEVYSGDLKNHALQSKLKALDHIENKASHYENILDMTLMATKDLINKTKCTITSAILMLDTQSTHKELQTQNN
jgi:hypothetical protein